MRRLTALLIVLAAGYLIRAGANPLEPQSTALALGFTLIAAALAGSLSERFRLPRVTGYLLFGMVCGPFLANIISRPMARELQLVNGLAIVLIAFMAGLELNVVRLRSRLAGMLRLGGATILCTNVGFFALFWLLWPWLPLVPDAAGFARLALAFLLATIVSCSSPSVAMAVIAESRASGLLSELVVAVVIMADVVLMLLFTISMQAVRAALGTTAAAEAALLARLSWQLLGSFAYGAMLGAAFALYLKFVGKEVAIVLIAVCAVLGAVGAHFHFEPILAGLAAGVVVENIAPSTGDTLRVGAERGALPVLVIFFFAAGASLQLDALARIGIVAVVISAARMGLLRLGTGLGARMATIAPPVDGLVWMGLVSQAGVTLGLSAIVAREFPGWGGQLQTLVVALIALHQLIGPVLFRAALVRAGEVGKLDELGPENDAGALVPAMPRG